MSRALKAPGTSDMRLGVTQVQHEVLDLLFEQHRMMADDYLEMGFRRAKQAFKTDSLACADRLSREAAASLILFCEAVAARNKRASGDAK